MAARVIALEPLTNDAFAAFGQVIDTFGGEGAGNPANFGMARRCDHIAELVNRRAEAKPNLALFACHALELPLTLEILERHPHSSQTFLPVAGGDYLISVCESDGEGRPRETTLRAFRGRPGQGVNYAPGVWHHPILALGRAAHFATLVWEAGTGEDCVTIPLRNPVTLADEE